MSSLREAAQQALAYIEQVDYGPYDAKPVITALRAALAEQDNTDAIEKIEADHKRNIRKMQDDIRSRT